jgi:V8-like Glu-specific endopeptidase
VLTAFPVAFGSPEVRQVLRVLESIYREPEIAAIVQDAGLPIGQVQFLAESSLTWRSVYTVAAGRGRVPELLDTVTQRYPALRVPLDEVRAAQPVVDIATPVPPAQRDPDSPAWKNFSADGRAEAVIVAGQPTFVDVAFLAVGVQRARGVCRLLTSFPAGSGSGTGFRVGRRHLLTNHHVLFDTERDGARALAVDAWFNYENDVDGRAKKITQIRCEPATIVAEAADDWALITVAEPIPDEFSVLPIGDARTPEVDDRVYIIQHPGGRPKQIAFQHNLVRAVEPDHLQYWTDTDLGSSGSPVFDERWAVVGLHHFSVPAPSGDRIGVRNQGRRIDRVAQRIRARQALPELAGSELAGSELAG